MEAFFAKHSADTPKPENILSRGLPWGGLEEALRAQEQPATSKLAAGVLFDAPAVWLSQAGRTAMEAAAVTPWVELLSKAGTFSTTTLGRLPGSFMASTAWYRKLQQSASSHGETWLHLLFRGTIELENAHAAQAAITLGAPPPQRSSTTTEAVRPFPGSVPVSVLCCMVCACPLTARLAVVDDHVTAQSHKLRPNPHAARALALLAPSGAAGAWEVYMEAWAAAEGWADKSDPMLNVTMDSLVREICEFGRSTQRWAQLATFVKTRVPASLQGSDAVLYTLAYTAMHNGENRTDWKTAMGVIGGHCWPTYVGSGHNGLLGSLWTEASYARYASEHGVDMNKLTPLEGQKAIIAYPPPRNIGGIGTSSGQ